MINSAGVASALRSDGRMALEVLIWAFDFYRRHLRTIAAISSVPAMERFVVVLWGSSLPAAATLALEMVTLGARLMLVGVVIRLGISADDRLSRLSSQEAWARTVSFARTRWASLVLHLLLLAGAFVAFDVIPEQVAARWIPGELQSMYLAILLAVKNMTVIAFTFIWMVGIIRQMIFNGLDPAPRRSAQPRS